MPLCPWDTADALWNLSFVFKIIDINQIVPEADGLNIYSGFSDLQVEKKMFCQSSLGH